MSIELASVSVQENLGESGSREKRRADYRSYLLRQGPTSKMLCHMGLGAHMDALQAAFEMIPISEEGCYLTLAEYAADDILTVLSILRLDETSDEWPPEEEFADDPAMVERLKGATFEKWYNEHCDVQPYFNGHDASPQGYLANDLAHLSEWPKFETKAEWVAWCCEKGEYGRRRYNEPEEAEAIAGWLWHRYEKWKATGANAPGEPTDAPEEFI